MNFSEIKDMIRTRAGIAQDDAADVEIAYLVNSKLRGYTSRNRYPELETSATLTPVDGTSELNLPADFHHFKQIRFNDLLLRPAPSVFPFISVVTNPRYYRLTNKKLYVYPFGDVVTTDIVNLVYYKLHQLEADDDELLVPSLESTIIEDVASKLAAIKDTKTANALLASAREAYIDGRAENVGYD